MTVTTGDLDTVQVGIPAEALADLVRSLPDYRSIFDLAARHPAARVRIAVCHMENLSAEAVRLLADDPCAEVRLQLVSSKALVQHAETDMLLRLVASDPAVAEALAEYLYDFIDCEVDRVEDVLAAHPDPSVRLALAHNGGVSLSTLALLAADPDTGVAAAAGHQAPAHQRICPNGAEAESVCLSLPARSRNHL